MFVPLRFRSVTAGMICIPEQSIPWCQLPTSRLSLADYLSLVARHLYTIWKQLMVSRLFALTTICLSSDFSRTVQFLFYLLVPWSLSLCYKDNDLFSISSKIIGLVIKCHATFTLLYREFDSWGGKKNRKILTKNFYMSIFTFTYCANMYYFTKNTGSYVGITGNWLFVNIIDICNFTKNPRCTHHGLIRG